MRFPVSECQWNRDSGLKFVEEDRFDEFREGQYYPVSIGDVFASGKYQVLGKLGFGRKSTVWLARDLQ